MRMPSRLLTSSAVAVTLLSGVVAGFAVAAVPSSDGVISGCYASKTGALRVVDVQRGQTCSPAEVALRWNATGPQGREGLTGPIGATGSTGATGPVGPGGAPGRDGTVGPSGPAGQQGADGPVGPSGPIGAQGPAGPAGATGPQGERGLTGASGPTGAPGPGGLPGLPGPAGQRGPSDIFRTTVLSTPLPNESGNPWWHTVAVWPVPAPGHFLVDADIRLSLTATQYGTEVSCVLQSGPPSGMNPYWGLPVQPPASLPGVPRDQGAVTLPDTRYLTVDSVHSNIHLSVIVTIPHDQPAGPLTVSCASAQLTASSPGVMVDRVTLTATQAGAVHES